MAAAGGAVWLWIGWEVSTKGGVSVGGTGRRGGFVLMGRGRDEELTGTSEFGERWQWML